MANLAGHKVAAMSVTSRYLPQPTLRKQVLEAGPQDGPLVR